MRQLHHIFPALLAVFALACGGGSDVRSDASVTPDGGDPVTPPPDGGSTPRRDGGSMPRPDTDGGTVRWPDASVTGVKPTAEACTTGAECKGGYCLGQPGQPEAGNKRFAGGYCTTLNCTIDSQEGCGPDEWCIDGGGGLGGFCVQLCSKADGMTCSRQDHVCLGLGTWGGCFSEQAVECHVREKTGCDANEICVRIGFDDPDLGRCETLCDPMNDQCPGGEACYYIRRYNTAFCGTKGTSQPEATCSCDKCCVPDYACTPDLDGRGRHCKEYCVVAEGCSDGSQCVPLESGSPWGGCVAAGSSGT